MSGTCATIEGANRHHRVHQHVATVDAPGYARVRGNVVLPIRPGPTYHAEHQFLSRYLMGGDALSQERLNSSAVISHAAPGAGRTDFLHLLL